MTLQRPKTYRLLYHYHYAQVRETSIAYYSRGVSAARRRVWVIRSMNNNVPVRSGVTMKTLKVRTRRRRWGREYVTSQTMDTPGFVWRARRPTTTARAEFESQKRTGVCEKKRNGKRKKRTKKQLRLWLDGTAAAAYYHWSVKRAREQCDDVWTRRVVRDSRSAAKRFDIFFGQHSSKETRPLAVFEISNGLIFFWIRFYRKTNNFRLQYQANRTQYQTFSDTKFAFERTHTSQSDKKKKCLNFRFKPLSRWGVEKIGGTRIVRYRGRRTRVCYF